MRPLDFAVMAAYFAAVIAIGIHFTRRQADASDYFLGRHTLPWWAIMLSIVATETSALTVISVPGIAAAPGGDLTFLQIPFGYLIGRVGVAWWLLPGYFTGEQETAYVRLETRFGLATRRVAATIFMGIRAAGDSVRLFATAIPLAIILESQIGAAGDPSRQLVVFSVLIVGVVTLGYTLAGGIKAVVWVDVLQLGIYVLGGLATIVVAADLAGGLGSALASAREAGKLTVVRWDLSFSTPYTLLGGLVGGALLSAASHGTDQLIVQRLLATRDLSGARRALVGSGILVIAQFAIFLLVGTLLWAIGADDLSRSSDEWYPRFVLGGLPPGLAGLVVAGLLAAAMSTVSSSLNSLASVTTHDFYSSWTGKADSKHLLTVGRLATLAWAVVLVGGALLFRSTDRPVVVIALSIASVAYGSLLGTYILAGLSRSARQSDAILAITVGSIAMIMIVLVKPAPFETLAWPWYVPLGTTITLAVGWISSLRHPVRGR